MSTGVSFFLFAILILLTGFFVATEFAIIKIRSSRVDQMVIEGRRNALAVKQVTSNLDGYLSACQLGITITALGLGWLGEPTMEKVLHPLFNYFALPVQVSSVLSFAIAFIVITFLHVVVGELAPKTLAIQKAEAISVLFVKPIIWFYKLMYPFIWMLNGSANAIIRLFGLKPAKEHEEAHSEEELQIILNESYESGKINNTEYGYVSRIFAFDELHAKDIMVPRTDMVCLEVIDTVQDSISTIKREQYTRYPVIQDSKDHVVGMVNTKQLFLQFEEIADAPLSEVMHPVLSVSEAIPVKQLLKRMQQERVHIAILIDEFGGTSGMVTIEDILEEIVGDIRDEFDAEEKADIEYITEDQIIVDGKVLLSDINNMLGTDIESEDIDTIGGWLYDRIPDSRKGSQYQIDGVQFTILEKDKHRVRKIEIVKG
ncbi:hemolysin family protein [Paenibacillus sp. MER TA 81-3]|uniref:hemolysin family protein n=1 Tax=Paenibacillus sp. MER TA 81-3 TaxID=2939573 RepID=UPI00203D83C5|nr:hemolysin family protein [Paenibacillus sp. MER TA 81-3]MCM3340360.1 hemolysin family protein [Paenibacillus sp. MER TA 81-3]